MASGRAQPRLAAVTMVYNEADFLPVWLRHYAAQVGLAHCHVIDHGSDDGSTASLGAASVIRLPRSPHDDTRRARFVSRLCSGLLEWYDGVLYADVDELVMADPAQHADLPSYFAAGAPEVSTAIGLNVMHMADEAPLDPTRNPLAQRRYAAFSSALCKPVLIRRPVAWAPGFHCADAPLCLGGLYLFHLRYADHDWALRRLGRTRAMLWAEPAAGAHQRVSDAEFSEMLASFRRMDRHDEVALAPDAPPLATWLQKLHDSQAGRTAETYKIDLHLNAYELWPIPDRFAHDAVPLVETARETHR